MLSSTVEICDVTNSVYTWILDYISDSVNVYFISTYAQISGANLYLITPTCFGVNTPSSERLQVVLWIFKMIKYTILVCRCDKTLVNMAAYVIPG